MTNREYLNSLSNDKFTDLIFKKHAELYSLAWSYFDYNLRLIDRIISMIRILMEKWLEEEYQEKI